MDRRSTSSPERTRTAAVAAAIQHAQSPKTPSAVLPKTPVLSALGTLQQSSRGHAAAAAAGSIYPGSIRASDAWSQQEVPGLSSLGNSSALGANSSPQAQAKLISNGWTGAQPTAANRSTSTNFFPLARDTDGQQTMAWPFPAAMPPPFITVSEQAAVLTGKIDGGVDMRLVDHYLSLLTGKAPDHNMNPVDVFMQRPGREYINLSQLKLDRDTLEQQGVAPHLIKRIHYTLQTNAMAFAKLVAAEQRRLGSLVAHKEGIPAADRLLAFITGAEVSLVDDLDASNTFGLDTAANPDGSQGIGLDIADPQAPSISPKPVADEDIAAPEKVMELEKIVELANSGNVVGLKRLLHQYRDMYFSTRKQLLHRLQHETARAGRLQDKVDMLADELKQEKGLVAEQQKDLDNYAARIRELELTLAEEREVIVAQELTAESLRGELGQMEAQWAAQQTEAVARVTEQLEALQAQAEGQLDLREQYLERIKELVMLQLRLDQELRRSGRLSSELETMRELAATAQEEGSSLKAWMDKMREQAEASENYANAARAHAADSAFQLSKERVAHRKTQERLQQVQHRVEQARCAAADVQARATAEIRQLSTEVIKANKRILTLERQLQEAQDIARIRDFEATAAKNSAKAAKSQLENVLVESRRVQDNMIAAHQKAEELTVQLKSTVEERDSLHKEQEVLQTQLVEAREITTKHEEKLVELEAFVQEKEEVQQQVTDLSGELAAAQSALVDLKVECEMVKAEVDRLAPKEAELSELQRAYGVLQGQLTERMAELKATLAELAAVQQDLLAARGEVTELQNELTLSNAREEEVRRHVMELDAQLAVTRENLNQAGIQLMGVRRELAEEKEVTAQLRAELQSANEELSKRAEEIAKLNIQVRSLTEQLRSSEAARYQSLADREWWTVARQQLAEGMQEFLSSAVPEAGALQELADRVRSGLSQLQGSMLGLGDNAPRQGEPSPLAAMDVQTARLVSADLNQLVARLCALIEREASVREVVHKHVQALEATAESRVASATDFWRDALAAARQHPKSMASYLLPPKLADLEMDPVSPLACLVPVGLLEQQSQELEQLHAAVGQARAGKEAADARIAAAESSLEAERAAADARQEHLAALVGELRDQISTLQGIVRSANAGRVMAEKLAGKLGKRVSEAEYQVTKAKEREFTLGLTGMVPLQRVDRGVQTSFAEMYVHAPPTTAAEAARRATAGDAPTWGADLGSGTVALPPLAAQLQQQQDAAAGVAGSGSSSPVFRPGSPMAVAPAAAGSPFAAAAAAAAPYATYTEGSTAVRAWSARTSTAAASGTTFGLGVTGMALGPAGMGLPSSPGVPCSLGSAHSSPVSGAVSHPSPGTSSPGKYSAAGIGNAVYSRHSIGGVTPGSRPVSAVAAAASGVTAAAAGGMPSAPASPQAGSPRVAPSAAAAAAAAAGGRLWSASSAGGSNAAAGQQPHQQQHRPVSAMPSMPTILDADEDLSSEHAGWSEGADGDVDQPPWAQAGVDQAAEVVDLSNGGGWDWLGDGEEHMGEGGEKLGLLSLQELMDVMGDIYRAKVQDDASRATAHQRPLTLREFIGSYLDACYSPHYGPRPLPPASQLVASVRAHAAAYEVVLFGRASGIIASHLSAAAAAAAAAGPGRKVRSPSASARGVRHSAVAAASPGAVASQVRGSSARPGTAPAPMTDMQLSPRQQQQAWVQRGGQASSSGRQPAAGQSQSQSPRPASAMVGAGQTWSAPRSAAGPSGFSLISTLAVSGTPTASHRPNTAPQPHQHTSSGLAGLNSLTGSPNEALTGSVGRVRPASSASQRYSPQHPAPASARGSSSRRLSQPASSPRKSRDREHAGLSLVPVQRKELDVGLQQKPLPLLDPAVLVPPLLTSAMQGLADVPGTDMVVRHVAGGAPMDHITLADLGQPIMEANAPELHFVLHEASAMLGLEVTPDLFELPHMPSAGPPALLLHVPHVSNTALAAAFTRGGGAGHSHSHAHAHQQQHQHSRPATAGPRAALPSSPSSSSAAAAAVASSGGGRLPRLPDGSFGWRRRALLLLRPGLLQLLTSSEAQAVLAMALVPMCLPGGGGWRLQGLGQGSAVASPGQLTNPHAGVGGLAVADVVTAVNVADVLQHALVPHLPHQLQIKWERLYHALYRVCSGLVPAGDRVALLVVQQLPVVAAAIYKAATGLPLPCSAEELIGHALAEHAAAAGGGEGNDGAGAHYAGDGRLNLNDPEQDDPHAAALARIAQLTLWSQSEDARALMAAGAPVLRRIVSLGARA